MSGVRYKWTTDEPDNAVFISDCMTGGFDPPGAFREESRGYGAYFPERGIVFAQTAQWNE